MPNIHLQIDTKTRLDNAIEFYCKEKNLPDDFKSKISYDFILKEILTEVNQ